MASPSFGFAVIRLSFNCHSVVIRCQLRVAGSGFFISDYSPQRRPQYDLPDLRGKQRTQSCLVFLFFGERPKNKKEHPADYSLELFTIGTIPSRITDTLICKRASLFGCFNVIKGSAFSFLSSQSRLRRDAFAVNTGFSIDNHQS